MPHPPRRDLPPRRGLIVRLVDTIRGRYVVVGVDVSPDSTTYTWLLRHRDGRHTLLRTDRIPHASSAP